MLSSQADPVVEEITIDETPTEEQLNVEPPPAPFEAMAEAVPEVLPSPEKEKVKEDSPAEIEVPCRDDSALNPEEDTTEERQKKKKLTKKREKSKKSGFNLFGRRALVLKLENLKIGSKVKLGVGRVDLKVLKSLRPDLFKVRVAVVSSVSRRKSVASSSGEQKKKKRPPPKEKVVKKGSSAKVTTVVSSGGGSDDSSDSELEAMKRKMNVKKTEAKPYAQIAREERIRLN